MELFFNNEPSHPHRLTFFADVLLPLRLPGYYTYRIPFDLNDQVKTGQRVVVQFGKKKIYTALVRRIHQNVPKDYQPKYIVSILDELPIVNEIQFSFWEWIAGYYMCNPGEVMNAALPSGLKLESETKLIVNPDFKDDYSNLNEKEYYVTKALQARNILTITEVTSIVDHLKVFPLINSLINKGVAKVQEELENQYKPKLEPFVRLSDLFSDEESLGALLDGLSKRAYKQMEIIMSMLMIQQETDKKEVKKAELLKRADAADSQLKSLVEKGVLEVFQKSMSRLEFFKALTSPDSIELSEHQQNAYDSINMSFVDKNVLLLHGVTGSGKTEIYIKLIDKTIKEGKQVLYLLPEIGLTTQIINRLRKYFGEQVGIYHSRFNEGERAETWNNLISVDDSQRFKIVLGARSAVFLPFSNLGLVIVDEEHDTSYKQYEPAPRYNARDSAIFLASLHKAKTVIGSATPSIESFFHAKTGKYGFAELTKRFGGVMLPEILVADIADMTKKRQMKSHYSEFLLDHIREALDNKEQIILFQNRRGYSLRVVCEKCAWTPECKDCDVTLTYHKNSNNLKCHYCGYHQNVPSVCPKCNSNELTMKGFGTEKVEEELPLFFPNVRIARMDLDTTSQKHAHQKLLNDFEDRRIDILVGTQMVTKGLDFDNVTLVGILNADNMIFYPDFRSFERSFQQISQVSGRAGRKKKRGKVIIQTYNPYHSVIRYAIDNDYITMYDSQIIERRNFKYPPFYRLIKISVKHVDFKKVKDSSWVLATNLRKVFGNNVLGPEFPMVTKIRGLFINDILIKIENKSVASAKQLIQNELIAFNQIKENKPLRIVVDVDPV